MWNNSVTSHDGGLEISLSGFQLARKSVVFRVFPAVFARLLVIKQRRGTCRFVHKMTNNGFEMIARFIFWCTCQFCLLFRQWIIFTYEYLSWKIFPGLKIILWTLSRYFSCFMWKVETGREISLRNNRLWQNDRLLSSWASKMKWEIDMGFLLLSILTFCMLFLGLFYSPAVKKTSWRRR